MTPLVSPRPTVPTSVDERRHDLVVSGGFVVDGTGAPGVPADIGVDDDLIAVVASPGTLTGHRVIDAGGLVVTPGFFDIHSHADVTILVDGRAQSALLQGVTSIVTGNCGYGAAPVDPGSRELMTMNALGWRVESEPAAQWSSFGDYLEVLRQQGVGANVFPLVAHGTLRLSPAGFEVRSLARAEIADLQAMTREAMDAGAIGVSTGLEYVPGIAASPEELAAVGEVVGAYDGLYASHCRNRTDRIEEAAAEVVGLARDHGCRAQLSHFLPRPSFAERAPYQRALEFCREAGAGVRFDVFPFDHGPTPLSFALPVWARRGARADVADRLVDPRLRARIVDDLGDRFVETLASGVAAGMYVVSDGSDGSLIGATLAELSGGRTIVDTVLDLLAAAGENFWDVSIVERWADWADLEQALVAEDYLIMGDGVTLALDGPLAGRGFSLSDWSYAPVMLATFVRDRELTSLEAAVHRMTMAPARQAGVVDRGAVIVGSVADLTVVDLAALTSYAAPGTVGRPPAGIRHVVVNGIPAVADGRLTGALAGRIGLAR
jgi:N-acyl-D-amino-acid deacylase